MVKKIIVIICLLMIINGPIFANIEERIKEIDSGNEIDDINMGTALPQNFISYDAYLSFAYLLTGGLAGMPSFGGAFQYERQITDTISAAGRLDYRMMRTDSSDPHVGMTAYSAEAHVRYYHDGENFFINGMLGYALFHYISTNSYNPVNEVFHFFKYGGKIGWRIDLGRPGGIFLEPSFGYYVAAGPYIDIEPSDGVFSGFFNMAFNAMIRGFFVGGPQVSLGLGYSF